MNASFPDLRGEHRTEPVPPVPNRLVADIDATLEQEILDLPKRQRIADIHHHREAIPFLLSYGIFRPLLPAALIADGLPLWRGVAIWRALGWTALLAMLIYASYLVLRKRQIFETSGALIISNWAVILVASYRGGGALWDNPRYRSAFAVT